MISLLFCINAALFLVILLLVVLQHHERKDLYNRIMSKTFTEYKGEPAPGYVSAHKRVLNRWRDTGGGDTR